MSHGIEQKDTMFAVGETPWHRLGKVVTSAPSIKEAIQLAGLDWKVGTKPLFDAENKVMPALATFREDDKATLGVVGLNYKPLQNSEAFDFFQPFIDNKMVQLETAGSLYSGRKVWVLAKVTNSAQEVAQNDAIENYVLLSNSHDGSLAIRTGFTPIRVVCNNTLTFAINDKRSSLIRIKHVGNPVEALEAVRETMNTAKASFEATIEQYKVLASKQIVESDLEKYVRVIFATKAQKADLEDETITAEELTSGSRVMDDIKRLFESGRGNDLPSIKGTYWAAYNAVTEYLQYESGRSDDSRLNSLWFGPNAVKNKTALKEALKLAV